MAASVLDQIKNNLTKARAELTDRVGMCGGSLTIRSPAGRGTVIEAVVPCA